MKQYNNTVDKAWDKMSLILDNELPVRNDRKPIYWILSAFLLGIIISMSYSYFKVVDENKNQKNNTTIAINNELISTKKDNSIDIISTKNTNSSILKSSKPSTKETTALKNESIGKQLDEETIKRSKQPVVNNNEKYNSNKNSLANSNNKKEVISNSRIKELSVKNMDNANFSSKVSKNTIGSVELNQKRPQFDSKQKLSPLEYEKLSFTREKANIKSFYDVREEPVFDYHPFVAINFGKTVDFYNVGIDLGGFKELNQSSSLGILIGIKNYTRGRSANSELLNEDTEFGTGSEPEVTETNVGGFNQLSYQELKNIYNESLESVLTLNTGLFYNYKYKRVFAQAESGAKYVISDYSNSLLRTNQFSQLDQSNFLIENNILPYFGFSVGANLTHDWSIGLGGVYHFRSLYPSLAKSKSLNSMDLRLVKSF